MVASKSSTAPVVKPQLAMAPKPIVMAKPPPTPTTATSYAMTPRPSISPAANSPATGAPQLSTSKVWVLPPRPKPGRKPSTDTPPTKRKAQNRAAQRAFRERRALRVSELEDTLTEVKNERDNRERMLHDKLSALSSENSMLRKEMEALRNDIMSIKSRRTSIKSEYGHKPSQSNGGGYFMPQMVSPAPSMDSPMELLDRALEERLPTRKEEEEENDDDCGSCLKENCICESLGIKLPKSQTSSPMPTGPSFHIPDYSAPVPLKRRRNRSSTNVNPFKKLSDDMETDYTSIFSKSTTDDLPDPKRRRLTGMGDSCGFCAPGTPCVCSEKTLAPILTSPASSPRNSRLPSLANEYKALASPISMVPVDQLYIPEKPTDGGCTGNPGNCQQCQADPMSTLFCTTLASRVYASRSVKSSRHSIASIEEEAGSPSPAAAAAATTNGSSSGCCGGSGKTSGGCCKDKSASSAEDAKRASFFSSIALPPGTPTTTNSSGTFIPCSAAYQTLSRHKEFQRADLGRIVGQLNTRGMQVEVGSVAKVLQELDRRFDK